MARAAAAPLRPPGPSLARLPTVAREGVVLAGLAAIGLLVVGVWWVDTPAGSLSTLADQLTAAGRITGLLGTYLALVEVVLMARVSWLDQAIGTDRLALWHRRTGEYTVGLLTAHAVLIVLGYARSDHLDVLAEARSVVLHYPDMLAATIGLGLLLAIGITSARRARQRLRYETWYFVHLYTYLALVLSFAHQLATGNDFVSHPLTRWLWAGMFAVAAGTVLSSRIGAPVRSARRHRLTVAKVVRESPRHVSVYISGHHLEDLAAQAGQHFRWRFLTRGQWWQSHPYSLSAAPNAEELRITVKDAGDHSGGLRRLRAGTRVLAEGPYGALTARRRRRAKVLLIAGGIGITPLRALFEELPARPGDLTLLYRASSTKDLVLAGEIEAIAARRGAAVRFVVGPRTMRPDPFAPETLARAIPALAKHDVFLCGPPGMTEAAVRGLRAAGVPRSHVHTEDFAL
jgi:predicted ferric reductase